MCLYKKVRKVSFCRKVRKRDVSKKVRKARKMSRSHACTPVHKCLLPNQFLIIFHIHQIWHYIFCSEIKNEVKERVVQSYLGYSKSFYQGHFIS